MHLEILVEDQSGKKFLDLLIPRLIAAHHTFVVHPYRGIGRIPKDLKPGTDAAKRILLDQLPRLLRGFGQTFSGYGKDYTACVLVIVDLDGHPLKSFTAELQDVAKACDAAAFTKFCLAIEEGEAWLLGDLRAILAAYPRAKKAVLERYKPDSICGTWEVMADAIYPGGSVALKAQGWQMAGAEKSAWATAIAPHLNSETNRSPSFQHFRKTLLGLAADASHSPIAD